MKSDNGSNVYVITGDEPIQAQTLKRLLLFHKSVLFSDVKDEAIINDNEVSEKFPDFSIDWFARGHYPRVNEYEERYSKCLDGANAALKRGLLKPIESRSVWGLDPGTHWLCHNASLSDDNLIKSASIDATQEQSHLRMGESFIFGGGLSQGGYRSKYEVEYKEPLKIPNAHESWNAVAYLRIGRAIKSIRMAQALGVSPIAIDNINSHIALAFLRKDSQYKITDDSLMDFAISTEVINTEKLESNLLNASWDDILSLRKEILPQVLKTKEHLTQKLNCISKTQFLNVDDYLKLVSELRNELEALQEQEAEAWEKLRIGAIVKLGGAVGAGTLAGSLVLPALAPFPSMITLLVAYGLVSAATLNPELKQLLPCRKKRQEHPLFFLEKLKIT